MPDLTPQAIVSELDRYIIGQTRAKRAVAVALRNRVRRLRLPEDLRGEVTPKNIMMIGPTGVGKTEIARRMAKLVSAPFVKVEVTKFTQVGYVGRDVETIIRDLVENAVTLVQEDKEAEVRVEAASRANKRLLKILLAAPTAKAIDAELTGQPVITSAPRRATQRAAAEALAVAAQAEPARRPPERATGRMKRISEALQNHQLDERMIELEVEPEDSISTMLEYMTSVGDEPGEVMHGFLTPAPGSGHKRTRRVSVRDARRLLELEEAQKLIDLDQVIEEATRRVEQNGIVFLDEIDKIVGSKVDLGPDVSGEGVQRDLLPIVEGSTVMTRYGAIKTDHILWIAAGAFHKHKPADLIPELQGRFPLRVELAPLTERDFRAILSQPENALTRQYQALLGTEDVELIFTDDGLDAMALAARLMNEQQENIGARRLHTILEHVIEEISFNASELTGQRVVIDGPYVRERLTPILRNDDLSRYIL